MARCCAIVCLFSFVLGCNVSSSNISGPKWDSPSSAASAFSTYDANGDHNLSQEELKKCPGLLAAVKSLDKNGDGLLSEDELRNGLLELQDSAAALVKVTCVVMRGGQPLEGATVAFIPEAFMGDGVKSASGVTASDGTVLPSIADADMPAEYRGRLKGVPSGIFRVEVTHPSIAVPAKFNTQTTIGRLVTRRDHDALRIEL